MANYLNLKKSTKCKLRYNNGPTKIWCFVAATSPRSWFKEDTTSFAQYVYSIASEAGANPHTFSFLRQQLPMLSRRWDNNGIETDGREQRWYLPQVFPELTLNIVPDAGHSSRELGIARLLVEVRNPLSEKTIQVKLTLSSGDWLLCGPIIWRNAIDSKVFKGYLGRCERILFCQAQGKRGLTWNIYPTIFCTRSMWEAVTPDLCQVARSCTPDERIVDPFRPILSRNLNCSIQIPQK